MGKKKKGNRRRPKWGRAWKGETQKPRRDRGQPGALSSSAPDDILGLLSEAGYDLTDEQEVTFAMSVYSSATMLIESMESTVPPEELPSEVPLVMDPAWIPKVNDERHMMSDLDRLSRLLQEDPDLKLIRLHYTAAVEHLKREMSRLSPEPGPEDLQRIASRGFQLLGSNKLLEALRENLALAAARRLSSPGEIRSLVLGYFLSVTTNLESDHPPDADILGAMLFDVTVRDNMDLFTAVEYLTNRLTDAEDPELLFKKVINRDEDVESEIRNMLQDMDPQQLEILYDSFNTQLERTKDFIEDERLPVSLPHATTLPFSVRLFLQQEKDEESSKQEIQGWFIDCLEQIGPEDLKIFGMFLDEWLLEDDHSDLLMSASIQFIRRLIDNGSLEPLDRLLLLDYYKRDTHREYLEGEEDVYPFATDEEEDALGEKLERYADYLEEQGYPAIAERTRELVSVLPDK